MTAARGRVPEQGLPRAPGRLRSAPAFINEAVPATLRCVANGGFLLVQSNILHVAEVVQGGIATHLNELLPGLAERRPAGMIRLIAPAEHVSNLSDEVRRCVDVHPYARSGRNVRSLLQLAATLRRVCGTNRPDLVHAHSSFAGLIGRVVPGTYPVVYTPNGWAFDMEAPAPLRSTYAFAERQLSRRAGKVITVSEAERLSAMDHGLSADRLVTVHNGIGAARLRPKPDPSRQGPLRLLFVGRFDRQKGLDWLVKVFAEMPPEHFVLQIVGAPTQNFAVDIPDAPHIRSVGWQTPDGVETWLDWADALVMPSRWEGFSLLALEAMRSSTALIVSDRCSLPEAINWGECGHAFSLDDPQGFRTFLSSLRRDTLLSWGEAGRRRFAAHFSSAEMCRKTELVYESLLSGPEAA